LPGANPAIASYSVVKIASPNECSLCRAFWKQRLFSSALKISLAYVNAGAVVVNIEMVELAPSM
jgi:hypothetical protein